MSEADGGDGGAGRWPARVARGAVLLALPASLSSPGITVCLAVAAICGLILWRRQGFPEALAGPGRALLGLYLLLLVLDALNGNPAGLPTTAVNYLPLIALIPFAIAASAARLSLGEIDIAMQATIGLAVVAALVQTQVLGMERAEGLNLNSNPFALVVAVWSVWQLARGLEARAPRALAFALAGVVPVVLSGSKNALAAMAVGVVVVTALHVLRGRRKWPALLGLAILAGGGALALSQAQRLSLPAIAEGVAHYAETGELGYDSFGARMRLLVPGIAAFEAAPLLGHGQTDARAAVQRHIPPEDALTRSFSHLHNDYLTHLVAFGIGGGLFVAGFLALVVGIAARAPHAELRVFGAGFAAMLAGYMLFDIIFSMDPVSGLWAVTIGLMLTRFRTVQAPAGRRAGRPAGQGGAPGGTPLRAGE